MLPFQGGVEVVNMLCPTRCVGFYIYCPCGAPARFIRNIEGYVVIIASCHLPEDIPYLKLKTHRRLLSTPRLLPEDLPYLKLKRLKAFDTYSPGHCPGLQMKPITHPLRPERAAYSLYPILIMRITYTLCYFH